MGDFSSFQNMITAIFLVVMFLALLYGVHIDFNYWRGNEFTFIITLLILPPLSYNFFKVSREQRKNYK